MSEPIAWVGLQTINGVLDIRPYEIEGFAPLYTHPMRKLTDEEIMDAWLKFPNWVHEQHILMFGRELFKKASEK